MTRASAADRRLGLIDGLLYADGYDCAVTLDELCRYATVPVEPGELARLLREDRALRAVVAERDGLYCLAGRAELAAARAERIERARRLKRRARRVARALRHVPFVRGLLLTGSTAADDAHHAADVDVLVLVAPGRLGTVFLLLGTSSRLLRRRLFCPNYYLRADDLALDGRTLYLAREIAQAAPLVGGADSLRRANPWLAGLLPNAFVTQPPGAPLASGSRLQRGLERALSGRVGHRLETRALRIAAARVHAHFAAAGEAVPPPVAARLASGASLEFHRGRRQEQALHRHAELRRRVALDLERLDRPRDAAPAQEAARGA